MNQDKMHFETRVTHVGHEPDPLTGAVTTPIYQASTFVFPNVDEGAARFRGEREGYIYTRLGNPTISALERCVSSLEGADKGLAFGSGMAAISALFLATVRPGDHVVADECIYGSTHTFLARTLASFGVQVDFIDCSDPARVGRSLKPNTKVIYFESPANPLMKMVDMESVVRMARPRGILTVVDNTFMSPYFQRPLEWGIDVVVHSATKYLGGHGDVLGGLIVGPAGIIDHVRVTTQREVGGIMSPFDAWLILRGIKTLAVRMERHEKNAMVVAEFLEKHPAVERVYYPGLPSHPQYAVGKKQMTGFGGMMSFELKGGFEAGRILLDSVRLCHLAVSLGETSTLIQHPASMTHSNLTPEERHAAGISDGLIRLSVGLEHPDDIVADLQRGLSKLA